jgi:hypothetical protein
MVMHGQLITVMYTGGTRIFFRKRDETSHHGPGPDLTPVESAQAKQPH